MPRLTDLTKTTDVLSNDYVYIVDTSDTSKHIDGSSKRAYISDLFYSYAQNPVSGIISAGTVISGVWNATPIESEYIGAHSLSHSASGSDSIKLDELGLPTDNTNLNANENKNGLLPKLDNNDFSYLNGHGEWVKEPSRKPKHSAYFTSVLGSGTVLFEAISTTGYVAAQWWDGSVVVYGSGNPASICSISKSIPSGVNPWAGSSPEKEIYIWSAAASSNASSSGSISIIAADTDSGINHADLSDLTDLTGLVLSENNIEKVDVSSLSELSIFGISNSPIDYIDLTRLQNLNQVALSGSDITELKVPSGITMEYLLCYDCDLISISAPECSFSLALYINSNNLSSSALNNLFTDLSSGGATIHAADNPGSLTCDTSIATEKGYTVITS